MDIHASDPVLIAAKQFRQPTAGRRLAPSADVLELCRVFLLNFYLRQFGRVRLFELLQREHERHNLATGRAFALLLACFLATWLLQTRWLPPVW